MTPYLRYSPDVERIDDDELETFAKIAEAFQGMGEKVEENEGRRVRVSHARPTALLKGKLIIEDVLPAELAQGLAAGPGRYEALVRFAQGPGENLSDRISTHRGMAVKLLGIEGERIPEAGAEDTQDFLLEGTGRAFINSTATTFLANLKAGVSNAPSLSEGMKNVVSKVARGTEAALEAVGLEVKTLDFFGHPPMHPLAEAYFSQAPLRWGDYVAKVGIFPTPATCESLAALEVDNSEDFDAFRNAMIAHFAKNGATFELRVQLATDLDATPVEDASVDWSEDLTPYRTVARLVLPAQLAWTPESDALFEGMSFRPAHSLTAHRPLGQVMRARLYVYQQLARWRGARERTDAIPA